MIVYRTYIYLSSREWGNELMKAVADAYVERADERPLIVSVHEHAGWFLSFLYGIQAYAMARSAERPMTGRH